MFSSLDPEYFDILMKCGSVSKNKKKASTTTEILQYFENYSTLSFSSPFPTLPASNDSMASDNFMMKIMALASTEYPINGPLNSTERIFISVSVNERSCGANATCRGPNGNRLSATLNTISFATPTSTNILQAYYRSLPGVYTDDFPDELLNYFNFTGDVGNNTLYPTCRDKGEVDRVGAAVEIVFQSTNTGNIETHPIHLHGYSFSFVGMGYGNFNLSTAPESYNLEDPPQLNTFDVPNNGWATIRFVANNPGVYGLCTVIWNLPLVGVWTPCSL